MLESVTRQASSVQRQRLESCSNYSDLFYLTASLLLKKEGLRSLAISVALKHPDVFCGLGFFLLLFLLETIAIFRVSRNVHVVLFVL